MSSDATNLPFWLAVIALARQATRDPLTGLYNRRYLEETLADHVEAARRYDRELSLVLFDLDQLKQINDTFGHEAGDARLRAFAECLRSTARKADIVCRLGGDEFAVILPETGYRAAELFVERMQGILAGLKEPLAVSAGIAVMPCENLLHQADSELIRRKQELREC